MLWHTEIEGDADGNNVIITHRERDYVEARKKDRKPTNRTKSGEMSI